MICSYPSIDEKKLKNLQQLENETGCTLLALSCQDMKPAQLTSEQLERIKSLEEELGIVVLAL